MSRDTYLNRIAIKTTQLKIQLNAVDYLIDCFYKKKLNFVYTLHVASTVYFALKENFHV